MPEEASPLFYLLSSTCVNRNPLSETSCLYSNGIVTQEIESLWRKQVIHGTAHREEHLEDLPNGDEDNDEVK